MRRFRLHWGEHSIRTKDTAEELLTWAKNCLHDAHANLFDGEEYICTVRAGELGSVTYAVNGDIVSYYDVLRMCGETSAECAYADEWHDHIVAELTALDNLGYSHVHAIFGGALWDENTPFDEFVDHLDSCARNAKFWKWPFGRADAVRRYCHMCYRDPALLEAYLGMPLDLIYEED